LNLTAGTVLHVAGYSSRGHSPKDKYVVVIGAATGTTVLGFLVSSRGHYMEVAEYRRESVVIPAQSTSFLGRESYVQCWVVERLDRVGLEEGFRTGQVERCGQLSGRWLHKIREVVENSELLTADEVRETLRVLPSPG
jgi:hypothetical protein